jgi:hypothetical protein
MLLWSHKLNFGREYIIQNHLIPRLVLFARLWPESGLWIQGYFKSNHRLEYEELLDRLGNDNKMVRLIYK